MPRTEQGSSHAWPVLVVCVDPTLGAASVAALQRRGLVATEAVDATQALEALRQQVFSILVIAGSAFEANQRAVIDRALALDEPPVILAGLAGDAADPRRALRRGIFDRLPETSDPDAFDWTMERAVQQADLVRGLRNLVEGRAPGAEAVVGESPAIRRLRDDLDRLAGTDDPVWLRGDDGTGRQLAARRLHAASPRRNRPFVVVGCAALADGPRPAAWSAGPGNDREPRGPLDHAAGGTLYLDELTRLPIDNQQELLDELRGGSHDEVRLISSSNRLPDDAILAGTLLDELAGRLSRVSVEIPALRDRPEDIAPLARHFAANISRVNRMPAFEFAADAISAMERHAWPGNVRELREAIEHATILALDGVIRSTDLPGSVLGGSGTVASGAPLSIRAFRDAKREVVDAFEEAYLRDLLERHAGNVTAASTQSGMLRSALQRLLRKHGLKSVDFRRPRRRSGIAESSAVFESPN